MSQTSDLIATECRFTGRQTLRVQITSAQSIPLSSAVLLNYLILTFIRLIHLNRYRDRIL